MKRFTIPCDSGAQKAPFHIHVGNGPAPGCHPLKYQQHWLEAERGGAMPNDVVESFEKLRVIATDDGVSFEERCIHALGQAGNPAPEPQIDSGLAPPAAESRTGTPVPGEAPEPRAFGDSSAPD